MAEPNMTADAEFLEACADTPNPADAEFSAIRTLYAALEPLDDDARSRVVTYIVARLEIALQNVVGAVKQ